MLMTYKVVFVFFGLLSAAAVKAQILNQWTNERGDEADFCHLLFLSGYTFESQIPIRGECGNSVDIKRVDLLPIYNDIFCPRQVELPHLISAAHFKKAASVA